MELSVLHSRVSTVMGGWLLILKTCRQFCYQNCSSDREKLLKFVAEGQEFENFLRSLEQFIQTVKGQNNVW